MKLNPNAFKLIKDGIKTIEVRLYDPKRQLIKLDDTIEFEKLPNSNETLKVNVTGLLIYPDFKSLFEDFPGDVFGGKGWSVEESVENMLTFYSKEDEKKFGVLGVKIGL